MVHLKIDRGTLVIPRFVLDELRYIEYREQHQIRYRQVVDCEVT